jgi:hypothetical protein
MKYNVGDVLIPHPRRWSPGFISQGFRFTVTRIHKDIMDGHWSFSPGVDSSVLDEHILGLDESSIITKVLSKYL